MLNTDPHGFLYRTVAVIAGLAIIGFGVGHYFAAVIFSAPTGSENSCSRLSPWS
jgi:uncharacterized membrane protein YczE